MIQKFEKSAFAEDFNFLGSALINLTKSYNDWCYIKLLKTSSVAPTIHQMRTNACILLSEFVKQSTDARKCWIVLMRTCSVNDRIDESNMTWCTYVTLNQQFILFSVGRMF